MGVSLIGSAILADAIEAAWCGDFATCFGARGTKAAADSDSGCGCDWDCSSGFDAGSTRLFFFRNTPLVWGGGGGGGGDCSSLSPSSSITLSPDNRVLRLVTRLGGLGCISSFDASTLAFRRDDFLPVVAVTVASAGSSGIAFSRAFVSLPTRSFAAGLPRPGFFTGSGSSVFALFDFRTNWKSSSRS